MPPSLCTSVATAEMSGGVRGSIPHTPGAAVLLLVSTGCRAQGVALGAELEAAAADITPAMDRAKVTRGKGGEVMRSAICRRVQICSILFLQFRRNSQKQWELLLATQ